MYIPNLNFPAQFGGELSEKQTKKIRKTNQEITPLGDALRGFNKAEESKPPKGTSRNYIKSTYSYIKFQLSDSIWRGDTGGNTSFQIWT